METSGEAVYGTLEMGMTKSFWSPGQQQLYSQVKREVYSALGSVCCIIQGKQQSCSDTFPISWSSECSLEEPPQSPAACAQQLESDIMGHHKSQPQLIPHLPVAQDQSLVVPIPELIFMEVIQPNYLG